MLFWTPENAIATCYSHEWSKSSNLQNGSSVPFLMMSHSTVKSHKLP